jgi:hypothetical protein
MKSAEMHHQTRVLSQGVALALLCFATGCQSVSTVSTRTDARPIYAPVSGASVQVLRTAPANRNLRLGEIQVVPADGLVASEVVVTALRTSAAELGADAVVVVLDPTQLVGAYVTGPWYGHSIAHLKSPIALGVAIKYK